MSRGYRRKAQWDEASRLALALFGRGLSDRPQSPPILVDTKYEFGFDESGRIVLADEIHTPDKGRYSFAESYPERFAAGQRPQSFDKDFVRTR